jgi:inactivated superfamily I helicase
MSNERKARIVTIVILVVALGVVVVRTTDIGASIRGLTQRADPTPQDAIYAMLDAARTGDVKKYMATYTGQMEQSLQRAKTDSADFAKYLRDSNTALKGIAVMEPQALSDREVKARVEYVYEDRNEIQFFYLEKSSDGWKISRVELAERVKTLVPYGTPVQ